MGDGWIAIACDLMDDRIDQLLTENECLRRMLRERGVEDVDAGQSKTPLGPRDTPPGSDAPLNTFVPSKPPPGLAAFLRRLISSEHPHRRRDTH